MPKVVLHLIAGQFAVCRLDASEPVPIWAGSVVFSSVTRNADELSVICPAGQVPAEIKAERDWCLLKFAGPFGFQEVGILASVATPLAAAGISLLAVGTFDTDYVFIKAGDLESARRVLQAAGHTFRAG